MPPFLLIRNGIGSRIRRGHADVYITVRNTDTSSVQVEADFHLASHYLHIASELSEKTGTENDMTVSRILQMEGVTTVTEREMDQETVAALCAEAVDAAMDQLVQMREKEGEHLQEDLAIHLDSVETLRGKILSRAPDVVREYRERLEARIKSILAEGPDPQRLAQEVALMADRCAIDEELARLESHIRQFRIYLAANEDIGKKMDFLIQEMNRETNTIGSNAQNSEDSR